MTHASRPGRRRAWLRGLALAPLALATPRASASTEPAHLRLARELVASLAPERTAYRHQSLVRFAGDGEPALALTDCSGLLNALLERTHSALHAALVEQSRRGRPQARDYAAVIDAGRALARVDRIDALRPGDLIAIRYPHGLPDTGHVMLVDAAPERFDALPAPAGLQAWAVTVIDASRSPHGPQDDRAGPPPRHGVGRGPVRLFADAAGAPAGYCWSLSPRSQMHAVADRPIGLGRPG